jgi:threonine dehydrogenase-like Zn-dependent dehydrogenase
MPRELIALAPRRPALRAYRERPLGPEQVRVRAEFAAPKHGTDLVTYRGEARAIDLAYDRDWGCFLPAGEAASRAFPRRLGNMAVGTVTDVGGAVTRFRPGDRVFGHLPVRETHTVHESRLDHLPPGLSPEAAVCLDPAVMALALRDADIRLGDSVAVFGLGAIGLFAVQLARLSGADQVLGVDPILPRRALAARFGADHTLAPGGAGDGDAGLAVRRLAPRPAAGDERAAPTQATVSTPTGLAAELALLGRPRRRGRPVLGGYTELETQTGNLGVDVAVEASGSPRALQDAIRATRFGGTVCLLSYYASDAAGVHLGEEFHLNRLRLVSCRAQSLPLRDAPGWTLERLTATALRWLASGRLQTEGIVTPIVPFEESPEAFREIDAHPETSVKLGIRFGP